ncbi:MAG: hypothetical protein IT373_28500 [Polyangiaceae bacterium]|nr:hypothetical protein [Polyangiaceae bacterium]
MAGLAWLGCKPAGPPTPSPVPVGGTATEATLGSATPGAPSAEPPPGAHGGAELACGTERCRVGREVCCTWSDVHACRPLPVGASDRDLEAWARALATRCSDKPPTDLSLTHVATCDDSADCGAKRACCEQGLGGDMAAGVCTPAGDDRSACDYGERCTPQSPCRTPGTRCIEGHCSLGPARRCGSKACTDAAPLCCGELGSEAAPRCGTTASCEQEGLASRYECGGPSDCPKGEHCMATLGGTSCLGVADVFNAKLLCAKDADCPPDMCQVLAPGARPSCKPDADASRPWLPVRACNCPGQ